MSDRVEQPAAVTGRGRGIRLTLTLALLAGTAACTASPRYPITMGDKPGDGGLTPWQPRYAVSPRDAAQNAADSASGAAVPPRDGGAYRAPSAPAVPYYARPQAAPPPPPPASDDDAPHALSSAPVESSTLPPPAPTPAPAAPGGPYLESELEAERPVGPAPGVILASYAEAPGGNLAAGVELAAYHRRRHAAAKDEDAGEEVALKPGETLEAAAKRLHVTADALMAANHIKDARRVRAGTVLKVPGRAKAERAEADRDDGEHAGPRRAAREAASAEDAGQQVTLKAGESLQAAAKRLHVSLDELVAANAIKNPRRVRAGTVLKVPSHAARGESAEADQPDADHARGGRAAGRAGRTAHAEAEAEGEAAEASTYAVKKGDTLYSIGRRVGKDPEALAKLNGLRSAASLRAGQVLRLAASDRGERRHGEAEVGAEVEAQAQASGREIDLPAPDRFTQAAMRKEAKGLRLTRRERRALAREDAREKAAALAQAEPKRRRGSHPSEVSAEMAADAAATDLTGASSHTRRRAAVADAEGPATYNPPPPNYRSAPVSAPAAPGPSLRAADVPPPAAASSAVAGASAPGAVATLNAPSYRATYNTPSLGRARPADAAATEGGALTAADIAAAGKGRFVWPLRGSIIAPFGDSGPGQHNDGVDIAAEAGEGVHAAAAGEVVYAGSSIPGFGNLVLVKHAGGWVTAYAHLNRIEVRMRDTVAQGDEIGQAGQTGAVDRPTLHFEVRYAPQPTEKARPVDPALVLPGG